MNNAEETVPAGGVASKVVLEEQPCRVLLVDDSPHNLEVLRGILRPHYTIMASLNGPKALQIAQSDPKPEMILLDIMMPEMDGYEVCRRLKADSATTRIPIIFVTAKEEVEDERRGLELGACDYIVKPVNPAIVLARVHNQILLHRSLRSLEERNFELATAKAKLEEAQDAQAAFVRTMAHELRTPLHAILSFADIAGQQSPDSEQSRLHHYLGRIADGGKKLLTMVDELLELSQLESPTWEYAFAEHHLPEVVREAALELQQLYEDKGVTLLVEDFEEAGVVHCDRSKMLQVFRNLLGNALKFTPAHKRVTVSFAHYSLALPDSDHSQGNTGALRVAVADEGVGLPSGETEAVFQKFFQSSRTKGKVMGTGLGLAVCREIVKAHRGVIAAENNEGGGACFWLALPCCGG